MNDGECPVSVMEVCLQIELTYPSVRMLWCSYLSVQGRSKDQRRKTYSSTLSSSTSTASNHCIVVLQVLWVFIIYV